MQILNPTPTPDAGKDRGQEKKGATEDEMVGWHGQLNGHEFEHTLGDGEGQGSLTCQSPWGVKKVDMTERMNKTTGQIPGQGTRSHMHQLRVHMTQ